MIKFELNKCLICGVALTTKEEVKECKCYYCMSIEEEKKENDSIQFKQDKGCTTSNL